MVGRVHDKFFGVAYGILVVPSDRSWLLTRAGSLLAAGFGPERGQLLTNFNDDFDRVDGEHPPYADPVHRAKDYRSRRAAPFSNAKNETSCMVDGFNDSVGIHAGGDAVRLAQVERPAMTILLSLRADDSGFCMDLASKKQRWPKLDARGPGAHFLLADGSARLVPASEYREQLWLARKGLDE